jgi:hypothetical protein
VMLMKVVIGVMLLHVLLMLLLLLLLLNLRRHRVLRMLLAEVLLLRMHRRCRLHWTPRNIALRFSVPRRHCTSPAPLCRHLGAAGWHLAPCSFLLLRRLGRKHQLTKNSRGSGKHGQRQARANLGSHLLLVVAELLWPHFETCDERARASAC